MAEKEFINPPGLMPTRGWTHVVAARGARVITISGQIATDAQGQVVGRGDLGAQTVRVFENLKIALAAAGATFEDVVKTTVFVVNFRHEDLPLLREVRARYLPVRNPPASTLVGVTALALEGLLVEIEATAVV
jgi:enamine deaminase RidA (YjgF/YER057c/UK114 family)